MSEPISLILDAAGVVVRTGVGLPESVPHSGAETAVLYDAAAAAAGAWFGSKRLADGSWVPPGGPPRAPTKGELIAYALRRRWELSETGTVNVTIASGTYPLLYGQATRSALDAAMLSWQIQTDYAIPSWFIPSTLQSIVLKGADIQVFAFAARDAFQALFDYQAKALAGIGDGSVNTTARVEEILAGG